MRAVIEISDHQLNKWQAPHAQLVSQIANMLNEIERLKSEVAELRKVIRQPIPPSKIFEHCPKCGSSNTIYIRGRVVCRDCGR